MLLNSPLLCIAVGIVLMLVFAGLLHAIGIALLVIGVLALLFYTGPGYYHHRRGGRPLP